VEARRPLAPSDAARFAVALRRRTAREPLQHIVGTQSFRHVTVRVNADAPGRLAAGGALVLETAGGEQARAIVALMQAAGFERVETRRDLAGVERFVMGRLGHDMADRAGPELGQGAPTANTTGAR